MKFLKTSFAHGFLRAMLHPKESQILWIMTEFGEFKSATQDCPMLYGKGRHSKSCNTVSDTLKKCTYNNDAGSVNLVLLTQLSIRWLQEDP